MYGLLLESIGQFLRQEYGEDVWEDTRRRAHIEQHSFSTHIIYPESIVPRLAEAAAVATGKTREFMLTQLGHCFVTFVSKYGYDKILRVLGRHMRDFLNGLDNLHEYMRFSYPKLMPPSFFVEHESEHGLVLHYRSKRRYPGFIHYVRGQLEAVAQIFYNIDVRIDVLKEEFSGNVAHVVMQLYFDNSAFAVTESHEQDTGDLYEAFVDPDIFLDVFPFHVLFGNDMVIKSVGSGLTNVMAGLEGYDITNVFTIKRPLTDFTWESVLEHTNNLFEIETVDPVSRHNEGAAYNDDEAGLNDDDFPSSEGEDAHGSADEETVVSENDDTDDDSKRGMQKKGGNKKQNKHKSKNATTEKRRKKKKESAEDMDEGTHLLLKGQMVFMSEWQAIMFVGTPDMGNMDKMFQVGLFINDLPMHDNVRDLILAGTQHSAELRTALKEEEQKSRKLEENMRKLDVEQRRTDELLYQMIPRQVADRLRKGEAAVNTCQVFDSVTLLVSDIVGFTTMCSRISPLQVVNILNQMYSKFDNLCVSNDVYKVETIGDAYLVVSGAPEIVPNHAERIADIALDMLGVIRDIQDPSTGKHLNMRLGVHSGAVVGGVVGVKMPRYCLFGDTVNRAGKMEQTSQPMKIHISNTTHQLLVNIQRFKIRENGVTEDKGQQIATYYLEERHDIAATKFIERRASSLTADDSNLGVPARTPLESRQKRAMIPPITEENSVASSLDAEQRRSSEVADKLLREHQPQQYKANYEAGEALANGISSSSTTPVKQQKLSQENGKFKSVAKTAAALSRAPSLASSKESIVRDQEEEGKSVELGQAQSTNGLTRSPIHNDHVNHDERMTANVKVKQTTSAAPAKLEYPPPIANNVSPFSTPTKRRAIYPISSTGVEKPMTASWLSEDSPKIPVRGVAERKNTDSTVSEAESVSKANKLNRRESTESTQSLARSIDTNERNEKARKVGVVTNSKEFIVANELTGRKDSNQQTGSAISEQSRPATAALPNSVSPAASPDKPPTEFMPVVSDRTSSWVANVKNSSKILPRQQSVNKPQRSGSIESSISSNASELAKTFELPAAPTVKQFESEIMTINKTTHDEPLPHNDVPPNVVVPGDNDKQRQNSVISNATSLTQLQVAPASPRTSSRRASSSSPHGHYVVEEDKRHHGARQAWHDHSTYQNVWQPAQALNHSNNVVAPILLEDLPKPPSAVSPAHKTSLELRRATLETSTPNEDQRKASTSVAAETMSIQNYHSSNSYVTSSSPQPGVTSITTVTTVNVHSLPPSTTSFDKNSIFSNESIDGRTPVQTNQGNSVGAVANNSGPRYSMPTTVNLPAEGGYGDYEKSTPRDNDKSCSCSIL